MLLRFRVSNFRSFRTEQTLSMVSGPVKDRAETVFHPPGAEDGVLPVAAIYGANASGKTNVILALQFMANAVRNSHAHWAPDRPIQLEPFVGESASPTTVAADFLLDGVRYQYGFSMNAESVLEEWVYAYPLGKKQTWFAREKGKSTSFSARLLGDNRTIERLTRPNSLFLSAAAQNNHEALSPLHGWFSRSLAFVVGERSGRYQLATLCKDAGFRSKVTGLLSLADLGITDVGVEVVPEIKVIVDSIVSYIEELGPTMATEFRPPGPIDREELSKGVYFVHRIGDSTLPFWQEHESKGTIAFLSLLAPALSALSDGGVVCVDELDESLHPLLAMEVIRLFSNAQRNPKGAQLIFNTHDANLLSAQVLRRDQIWFTEKARDGASQLYPLTDFKPRREENLENGYLQGRYGAIPFLNPDSFLASGSGNHEEE